MSAEGVLDDSIVTRRTPELYDDCVFQICPQQQYSAAKELTEYKSELQAEGFFDKSADEQSVASSARMVNPEDEEEPEGKWYYLGGNSFGELILNVIALAIAGVMLESHLNDGSQPLAHPLRYGVSITDACLGWTQTEELIGELIEG